MATTQQEIEQTSTKITTNKKFQLIATQQEHEKASTKITINKKFQQINIIFSLNLQELQLKVNKLLRR